MDVSRDPGDNIKEQLRREVRFGCPVRYQDGSGCGCPILTYHHFDPPWHAGHVHSADGMLALCRPHHDQADGGLWSNAQLREMKKNPYVDSSIRVVWPWQPETLVIKVGRHFVIGGGSAVRLNEKPIIGFRAAAIPDLATRTVSFDSEIVDINDKPWLSIKDSWLDLDVGNAGDVVFTPQTKTFVVKQIGRTFLRLKFQKIALNHFEAWARKVRQSAELAATAKQVVEERGAVDSDGNVPIMAVEGYFKTKEVEVTIKRDDLVAQLLLPGWNNEKGRMKGRSLIVKESARAILSTEDKKEFFSLG